MLCFSISYMGLFGSGGFALGILGLQISMSPTSYFTEMFRCGLRRPPARERSCPSRGWPNWASPELGLGFSRSLSHKARSVGRVYGLGCKSLCKHGTSQLPPCGEAGGFLQLEIAACLRDPKP